MRILAIESSGRDVSVAALEGVKGEVRLLQEVVIPGSQRTARLAPGIAELLNQVGWEPPVIQLVAVAVGPGSFTGLRIGVTTAKTLAYAVGAEVIGVNTLEVVAHQAADSAAPLWTVMDAQRKELFVAKFGGNTAGQRETLVDTRIMTEADWLSGLEPTDWVSGTAIVRVRAKLPDGVRVIDETLWQPRASAVGAIAWNAYRDGRRDDLWKLLPQYYRQSAAEEVRARRDAGK